MVAYRSGPGGPMSAASYVGVFLIGVAAGLVVAGIFGFVVAPDGEPGDEPVFHEALPIGRPDYEEQKVQRPIPDVEWCSDPRHPVDCTLPDHVVID